MDKGENINNKRQSNIELLRIIAMILIVAHHFALFGAFGFSETTVSINKLWIQFIQIGGKIGVNIFILISGYFLINEKSIKINKIIKFWLQIFTYSIIFFIIFIACGIKTYSTKELIYHMFPITYSLWWFASAYFVLYLLIPYVNKMLTSLNKLQYQKLIVLTTICWCIIPTIFRSNFQSNNLIWLIYMYTLAGYIRIHIQNIKISNKKCIIIALAITTITLLTTVILDFIGLKIPTVGKYATYLYGMKKVNIVLISVFVFIGFLKTDIKYNKVINTISGASFGVYLIHEHDYVRTFLWQDILSVYKFSNSLFLIPYTIYVILIVFAICTLIELIRINILEKNYLKYVDKISDKIKIQINRVFKE